MSGPYRNPLPTVDIIIEVAGGIVLIERRNPPHGWAIPGGFLDWGETVEACALREAREETGLVVRLEELFYVYSHPERDPRHHTMTTVFIASAEGMPVAADDAKNAGVFSAEALPAPLVFDHGQILSDYFSYRQGENKASLFRRYLHPDSAARTPVP
ncbi:NUDIX hydrolase [Desulfosarcina ovata subsp. sediminis]|uniref:NUDIX hydrolase n=1 Tax=Desulfosarcina ovata subsp. sediminis TaxID=885957 RepID=A0A5K7ZMJ0_9BACT|nr:NUDIX hydrolase [Desulfosarcina ovata]BBO81367.1 NUDIX hydrolase [Desulfosarcina ovata subsp. sediminis]